MTGRIPSGAGDLCLAASVLIAAIYFFSGYFTSVRFDRERIGVRVARGRVEVTGLYHYANESPLPAVLTLRVPFPVDADHPAPEFFSVCEADESGRCLAETPVQGRGEDVRVRLLFRPHEARWLRLDYLQPVRTADGRYLLTTTRPWRRPIAQAEFTLQLARDLQLASSNYPLEARGPAYTFSRADFFPDRDWVFAWREQRAGL